MSKFQELQYKTYSLLNTLNEQGMPQMPGMPPAAGMPQMPGMPPVPSAGAPGEDTDIFTKQNIDETTFTTERIKSLIQLSPVSFQRFIKQIRNKAEKYTLLPDFVKKYPEQNKTLQSFINATSEQFESQDTRDDKFNNIKEIYDTYSDFIKIMKKHLLSQKRDPEPAHPEQMSL